MNFIRIDRTFINLREVESIEVESLTSEDIQVTITYRNGREHIMVCEMDSNTISTIEDAMDTMCDSIYGAIGALVDADCENIEDYIDEDSDD
jgi:hypothetical protein